MTGPGQVGPLLLTGAGGFVGRGVAAGLRARGWTVFGADLHPEQGDELLDVLDAPALLDWAERHRPHAVLHAAALTAGAPEQVHAVNVRGTRHALQAAAGAGARHFVLFSSAGVYAPLRGPLDENAPLRDDLAYAVSKREAEAAVREHPGTMRTWALRIGPVYGPGERPSASRPGLSLAARLARAALDGERHELPYHPDAEQSWLHVDDLAGLLSRLVGESAAPGSALYNVGGPAVSNARLLALVAGMERGPPLPPRVTWAPDAPARHGALDTTRLGRDLGFSPRIPLEQGLADAFPPPPTGEP